MSQPSSAFCVPKVAALAITYHDDKLLLIQRGKEPQLGRWGFPGGSVHAGEALVDAARRELLEETHVHAEPEQIVGVIEVNEFDANGQHHHYVLIAVLCQYQSGTAQADDDAMACQWIQMAHILSNPSAYIDHVGVLTQQIAPLINEPIPFRPVR
ncbi:MAG: NUDIX hydrolase [Shewanellaceae bacterium]|nr:NUDIX hydrolase [Shewanellaceae bacterium]